MPIDIPIGDHYVRRMFSPRAKVVVNLLALTILHSNLQSAPADWTSIKPDLSEWQAVGDWWRVEDGVFIAESKGGKNLPRISYLQWKGSTGRDFELRAEYRIIAKAPQDAGLYFRVEQPITLDDSSPTGYQAELDTGIMYGKQKFVRDGKLFGHIHDARRRHMFKRSLISTAHPDGRITTKPLSKGFVPGRIFRRTPAWNECRVVMVGERLQLFLNGVLANEIIDRDPKKRSTGDGIALQYRPNGGYRYEVRNLKFRPADNSSFTSAAEPAPAVTKPASLTPVVDLLPAKDFSQFTVATSRRWIRRDPNGVFKLENGELVVSGKEPGLLNTRRSFTNYHFRVEYRWDNDDPKRDSGVFVNTLGPFGKQVSLECNLLGPDRGVGGELYLFGRGKKQLNVGGQMKKQGAIKPAKSFENPVGQWNTMDVLSDHGHFKLSINGRETVVGKFPFPRSGTIMLQSNRGAIRFRNARVTDYDAVMADVVRLARSGKLLDAAQGFERMFQEHPLAFNTSRALWLATLYAGEGSREAHERHCRSYFNKFANPKNPAEGSRPAKAYVLLPGANDPELLDLALKASKYSTDAVPKNAWFTLTRAMIEHRQGNHSAVGNWLRLPLKSKNLNQRTPALAFAAMAQFRLGNTRKAQQYLTQAKTSFASIDPSHRDWNDILGARLALEEAKALIK